MVTTACLLFNVCQTHAQSYWPCCLTTSLPHAHSPIEIDLGTSPPPPPQILAVGEQLSAASDDAARLAALAALCLPLPGGGDAAEPCLRRLGSGGAAEGRASNGAASGSGSGVSGGGSGGPGAAAGDSSSAGSESGDQEGAAAVVGDTLLPSPSHRDEARRRPLAPVELELGAAAERAQGASRGAAEGALGAGVSAAGGHTPGAHCDGSGGSDGISGGGGGKHLAAQQLLQLDLLGMRQPQAFAGSPVDSGAPRLPLSPRDS